MHGLKVLLHDSQLYQENYSTGSVKRHLKQKYELYDTFVAATLYDYTFLFCDTGSQSVAQTSLELVGLHALLLSSCTLLVSDK